MWKVECSAWGRSLLIAFVAGGALYAGGGTAYNQKVKGLPGKEAFPHLAFWLDLKGLVLDGAKFAQARASGAAYFLLCARFVYHFYTENRCVWGDWVG